MTEIDLSQTTCEKLVDCYDYLPEKFKETTTLNEFKRKLFSRNNDITKFIMNDNIINIPEKAFSCCRNLEFIKLSNKLKSIYKEAFWNCSNLKSIDLPSTISIIDESAFEQCSSLKTIILPNNVTKIDKEVFYRCTSLESVKLSSNLSVIDNEAFHDCSSLKYIDLPNELRIIGVDVFYNCSGLESVKLPANLETISYGTFSNCLNLTKINLPNSVTEIGKNAFKNCSNLKIINLSNNLKEIRDSAFERCSSLTEIDLPNSVIKIRDYAFGDCLNLAKIKMSDNLKYIGNCAFYNCSNLKEVEGLIDTNLEEIEYKCFYKCSSLTKIDLPNSIEAIRTGAFKNCSNLTEINIINVLQLEDKAFKNCSNLIKINVPKLRYMGHNVFRNCSNLVEIIVSSSIKDVPDAFYGCNKLINKLPSTTFKINHNLTECYDFYNDIFDKFTIPAVDKEFQFIVKPDVYDKYMNNKNINANTTEFDDNIIKNLTINDVIPEDETYTYLVKRQNEINAKLTNGELNQNYKNIFNKLFSSGFVLFNLQNCGIQNLFHLCCFLVSNAERLKLKFNNDSNYNFINVCSNIKIDDFLFKYVEFHLKFHYLIHKFIPRAKRELYSKNKNVYAIERGYNGVNIKFELFKTIITDIFDKNSCIIDDQEKIQQYYMNTGEKTIISIFTKYNNEYYDAYGHTAYICYVRNENKKCYVFDDLITVVVNNEKFKRHFNNNSISTDNVTMNDYLSDEYYTFFKSSKICNHLYIRTDEYDNAVYEFTGSTVSYKQFEKDKFNKIDHNCFYPLNIKFNGGEEIENESDENSEEWIKYILIGLIVILIIILIVKLLIKSKIFNKNID